MGAAPGVKHFFPDFIFSLLHIFNEKHLIALLSYPLSHLPILPPYRSVLFSLKKKKGRAKTSSPLPETSLCCDGEGIL